MRLYLDAISLALRQLSDHQTLAIVLRVLLLTLAIFVILGILLWWAAQHWLIPWLGSDEHWVDLAGLALTLSIFILFWFLFRAVAMAVMGLFTDGIVASVEQDHFPAIAARAVPVSWQRGLSMGLRSAFRALFWNMVASPLYLLLLFTGIGLPVALLLVNGLLLGRDLEQMVAARHPQAPSLSTPRRHALGFAAAGAFMVPGLNLVAPVFGAALAVHLFHAQRETHS
jgi:CysZ protein